MCTDSFLLAFRRFVGRCSLPKRMISDNGLTFVAGAKEIQKLCNSPEVQEYLLNRNVEWIFIPKRAPWFGGFYERLIGITKNTLKGALGRALLSFEELETLIIEVEALVNERPLTYVSTDVGEPEPITPAMLLHGRSITLLPHWSIEDSELSDPSFEVTSDTLRLRFKRFDSLIAELWKRWKSEYLPHLREMHRSNEKKRGLGSSQNYVKTGDVVLVHADTNRTLWPLGVVTKLNVGQDGLVRSAELRTKHGFTNRPITKLYPLEITLADDEVNSDNTPTVPDEMGNMAVSVDPVDPDPVSRKSSRAAAVKARSLLKKWSKELNS